MAIPTFVGEGTPDAVNASSPASPTNPASLAVDDILVSWAISGDDDKAITWPAGWTKVDESPDAVPLRDPNHRSRTGAPKRTYQSPDIEPLQHQSDR